MTTNGMDLAIRRRHDDPEPTLLIDGEPVPPDHVVTLLAVDLARWGLAHLERGMYAGGDHGQTIVDSPV